MATRRMLYLALLALRLLVCPMLPGYVHPDEYFQSGQELWHGCPPSAPWEFEPRNALRSLLHPTIATRLPLRLYSLLIGRSTGTLSGTEVLAVPRVACAVLSMACVDLPVWLLASRRRPGTGGRSSVPVESLVLASSWPALVVLSRPFSNSLESCLLTLLLFATTAVRNKGSDDKGYAAEGVAGWKTFSTVGVLCAAGLFTRFTFVFFAFPAVANFLHRGWRAAQRRSGGVRSLLSASAVLVASFLATAACIAYSDTVFYLGRTKGDDGGSSPALTANSIVLAPWNALSYNSKVSNLKDHGLHPRWTHVVVNMLILYGPMAMIAYTGMFALLSTKRRIGGERLDIVCCLVILFGLGFLSLAPHQEPRFLLPLIAPLALFAGGRFDSTMAWVIWGIFNAVLFLLYGTIHQAGVVLSLNSVGLAFEGIDAPVLIYFHTYMPPSFLSRSSRSAGVCPKVDPEAEASSGNSASCTDTRILDLKGSTFGELLVVLDHELGCSTGNETNQQNAVFVGTPPLADTGSGQYFGEKCKLTGFECRLHSSFAPHLTTEDFPAYSGSLEKFYNDMSLAFYQVSCFDGSA